MNTSISYDDEYIYHSYNKRKRKDIKVMDIAFAEIRKNALFLISNCYEPKKNEN